MAAETRPHDVVAHDRWFQVQVEQGLADADDPRTRWISNEEANAGWAVKRAALAKRVKESDV